MTRPKLLLTGAHGMVGRNIQEHDAAVNYEMLVPTRAELDLTNYPTTLAYLHKQQPDIVIHAAGRVGGIQANINAPVQFLLANLDMGRNIVWGARQAGIKRLINLGSSCMYPRGHNEPLTEDMVLSGELEPTNEGYALAKVTTARLCDYIVREDPRFQYKTLIPSNLYGRFDKFDPKHSHLVPAIILKIHEAMQSGHSKVEIWGDGTARREFMYAGDLADAVFRAVEQFESLPQYMNVGLGFDHTINQYYQAVADVLGYQGSFVHDLARPVGMARKLVSVTRQKAWGWSSRHTLEEGIARTYDYYLKEYRS